MSQFVERARHRWVQWIAAGVPAMVYALAAVIVTWPLLPRLNTHLAGSGVSDSAEVVRHIWYAREALLDGRFPFEQTLLAYPEGFNSWLQWSHPLQYLPGALLALVVSPVTAFNLVLLLTLTLNGCAAYVLGRRLTDGTDRAEIVAPGALLGGLVFLAYPAVQGHLSVGHLGIVTLWPLPLFAACWWGVLRQGAGWRTVWWGALWFALTALAYSSQIVVLLLPLVVVTGLAELLRTRTLTLRDPRWARAAVMLLAGALLLIPFTVPLLSHEGQKELVAVRETGRINFSADALAAVSPSPFGWLGDWGLAPEVARDVLGTNSAEGSGYVGLIALALALVALWRRPDLRVWGLVALVALVLALGPLLKWGGALVSVEVEDVRSYVPLPWSLLDDLPVLSETRTPGRFNLLTGLAISVLVSAGAAQVAARSAAWANSHRWQAFRARLPVLLAVAALAGGILLEYQTFAPYPTEKAALATYFDTLADSPDVRAVLDLPVDHNLIAKLALLQQTRHGHALIAGHALRRTPQNPSLLKLLQRAALGDGATPSLLPPIPPEMARWLLSQAGADRVIVHKGFVRGPESALAHARALLGAPEYEDDRIAAFVVPRTGEPGAGEPLVWANGGGWSEVVRVAGFDGRYMDDSATWHFIAAEGAPVEIVFEAAALGVPRRVAVWMDHRLVVARWIPPEGERVSLALWPESGVHRLDFEALEGCDDYRFPVERPSGEFAPLGDPACLSVALGAPETRALEPAPVEAATLLDQGVVLRGYTLEVSESPQRGLHLRLFWEAVDVLPESYALFVHLADPETDVPLAQVDEYPLVTTDRWWDGAAWTSDVWLALGEDVPPGQYAVNVGWFEPESGARLAVSFAEDRRELAGLVHLGLVTVGGD